VGGGWLGGCVWVGGVGGVHNITGKLSNSVQ
jgi:hypothetical protein